MADEAETSTPTMVKMPRARHELHTGKKPDDRIKPGTLLTDDVVAQNKLDAKTVAALIESGAIEVVDVLKG